LTLRSLASSDYGIFLEVGPAVVAFTVLTIERMMAFYKTILEIRVLRDQLKQRDTPEAVLAAIEEDLQKRLKDVAKKALAEALKEFKPKSEAGRTNELKTLAASNFTKLMERLDKDYDLDGRIGHAEKAPDDPEQKAEHERLIATDQKVRRSIKLIRKQIRESKNLKALEYKPDDEPPKPDDDD